MPSRRLPNKHLIAQNIANFRLAVRESDIAPGVSILNFHYAYPEAVTWNRGLGKLIGHDETGFAGSKDETYRREAWAFLLAGGGLYNNLDYSFHVGAEDGMIPATGSARWRQSGLAKATPGVERIHPLLRSRRADTGLHFGEEFAGRRHPHAQHGGQAIRDSRDRPRAVPDEPRPAGRHLRWRNGWTR